MADHCDDHIEMVIANATMAAQLVAAAEKDAGTAEAVQGLSKRVGAVEARIATWGGVIAALAAFPLIERVLALLLPAARAALGAP